MTTDEAIKKANQTMSTWTDEEVRQFAFDRLVDEILFEADEGLQAALRAFDKEMENSNV